jgi:hypothetical protein
VRVDGRASVRHDKLEAPSTPKTSDVLDAFLQFVRRQKYRQRRLQRGQRTFDVVALHFCRIDTDSSKCALDRAFGEHWRQAASLNYLVEERVHAIVFQL